MADAKYYPDQWREYCLLARFSPLRERPKWNRFAARYRAAASFQSAEFMKMSEKTTLGYSTGMRLLLSYSAFEYACNASDLKHFEVEIIPIESSKQQIEKKIKNVFGFRKPARQYIEGFISSKTLRSKLKSSFSEKQNLQPLCAVLRNMIAHGEWSPNLTNTTTKDQREVFDILSAQLLKKADTLLGLRVDYLKAQSTASPFLPNQ
jgi:hypothetical protein